MTNNDHPPMPADEVLEQLIGLLLIFGGNITLIIDHMALFSGAGLSPDAPPLNVVLEGLLTDVLRPVVAKHEPHELKAAVNLFGEIIETIATEIHLVPPEEIQEQV